MLSGNTPWGGAGTPGQWWAPAPPQSQQLIAGKMWRCAGALLSGTAMSAHAQVSATSNSLRHARLAAAQAEEFQAHLTVCTERTLQLS